MIGPCHRAEELKNMKVTLFRKISELFGTVSKNLECGKWGGRQGEEKIRGRIATTHMAVQL